MAAATSTSGTPFKPVGRIGDSPLYGSGGYAENGLGAAGATGQGEHIMPFLLSKYACDKLAEYLPASNAAEAVMHYIKKFFDKPLAGVIITDKHGNLGAAHTTPKLAIGWVDDAGNIYAATKANSVFG